MVGEIKEFAETIIKHSQCKSIRGFLTGSCGEIWLQSYVLKVLGLTAESMQDRDIMFYLTGNYAFPLSQQVPEAYNGSVNRIYSDGRHSGYVRIYDQDDPNAIITTRRLKPDCNILNWCGPADRITQPEVTEHLSRLHPKHIFENMRRCITQGTAQFDEVHALHSPWWPQEAFEWVTRQRVYGSPCKSTVREIVKYGCDFVQVSYNKLSYNPAEWRFSFSKAELLIISNWTTSQKIVYRTLHMVYKMIKSEMDDTVLCTYYFKTLMLWATEEKEPTFGLKTSLIDSVCELIM